VSVFVRPATLADTRQMAEIAGSSASPQALADWMDDVSAYAAWHVAENEAGALLGFQRVGASKDLSSDTCEIATFLRDGVPPSVGSRLFEVTQEAARLLGYSWIDARCVPANEGARVYYQSHGFRVWSEDQSHLLLRFELDWD